VGQSGRGKLAWHDAPDGNVHLRIFILDLADGRLAPGLSVRATLVDANGNEQSVPADFGWYPLINAYGGNIPMDTDSSYTLRVSVDALQPHHVFAVSEHFAHAINTEFPPVQISQDTVAAMSLASDTSFAYEADLLKPANAALSAAITALWKQSLSGSERPFGDYFVGYALDFSGLVMPLPGAKLHLKKMVDLSGKDSVRVVVLPVIRTLAASFPASSRKPTSSPPTANSMAPANCRSPGTNGSATTDAVPAFRARKSINCAYTSSRPASADGDARASALPCQPTLSSTTFP